MEIPHEVTVYMQISLPDGRAFSITRDVVVDQPTYGGVNRLAEQIVSKLRRIKIGMEDLSEKNKDWV